MNYRAAANHNLKRNASRFVASMRVTSLYFAQKQW